MCATYKIYFQIRPCLGAYQTTLFHCLLVKNNVVKEHIPRNAFVAWLALLRRLPTRDRLIRWGMNVPASCVLCSNGIVTHHHLFFECEYSTSIWSYFSQSILSGPPSDLHSAAALINRSSLPPRQEAVIKLIF